MRATIVGLVTPHLLRIVDLAQQAEQGVNVDWHLRDAVTTTMRELGDQYNAQALVASYIEGLESAAHQATKNRAGYVRALESAAASARKLGQRD
jgi:hypothetical protein